MSWDQINENLGWLNDNIGQYLPSGQLQRQMGRLHLAMPYSNGAEQDFTASVPDAAPLNHSLNWFESHILGITPSMKARDLQNDRRAYWKNPANKADLQNLELAGMTPMRDGKYQNTSELVSEYSASAPQRQALKEGGVTYTQLGMDTARGNYDKEGNIVAVDPQTILERAGVVKLRKQLLQELSQLGEVPKGSKVSNTDLQRQLKEAKARNKRATALLEDEITYGTRNPDGTRNNDGTEAGRQQIESHQSNIDANNESIEASKSTRRVNEGNLAINQTVARNNVEQSRADNDWRRYVYDDSKAEAAVQRQYEAGREDARYAARAKEIQMQNDADMKRYQLMLENDREVRRSEDLGDLFGALTMLGGAFMI